MLGGAHVSLPSPSLPSPPCRSRPPNPARGSGGALFIKLNKGSLNDAKKKIRSTRPLKAVLNVFFFFASFKLPLFNEYEMVFIIA